MVGILERSNGSYAEERLYVLATIEKLEQQAKDNRQDIAKLSDRLGKLEKDEHEAHKRIRALQAGKEQSDRRLMNLEIRSGYIAAGVGLIVAGLIEVLSKWFFH